MEGKFALSFTTVVVLLAIANFVLATVKAPLALDIWKESAPRAVGPPKIRRRAGDSPITQVFDNADPVYYANITIGTPGQIVRLWIITNAANTWVNTDKSLYCTNSTHPCLQYDDANSSATYTYLYGGFNETYDDGTGASGDWATDNFLIGDNTVSGLQFGIGYNSSYAVGTLGLGYISFEKITNKSYANLPVLLFNQGLIDCIAYSLWLDQPDSPRGQVVFGGVDTGKFRGTLATLPISMDDLQYDLLTIPLASVQISYGQANTTVTSTPLQIILDPTTEYIGLPSDVIDPIYAYMGTSYDSDSFAAFVPCSMRGNTTTIDFTFGSAVFAIPMSRLVVAYNATICNFKIIPGNESGLNEFAVGTAFTDSAYIVYDFSHNQVSLAPTNTQSIASNITLIGPNGVGTLTGTGPGSSTTSNRNNTSPPIHRPTGSPGLSAGAKAGIGVGAAIGGLLLLALAGYLFFRGRRRSTDHGEPLPSKSQPQMGNPTSPTSPPSELYSPKSLDGSGSDGVPRASYYSGQPTVYEIDSNQHTIPRKVVPERREFDIHET